ncbi:MerR family transcriptional regulator [Roseovarius arcticus]|uniref:MerR family transcriptional regulator n=1 Tax=Roseovarius arcticus TaxID=2547404 RepID=UPI001110704B|nr:MerR family transcriptional regulator [Roseovarius arcticus]
MKIGDLAKRTGLSAHTIRYYERIGLLPRADRDFSGRRDYDVSILVWVEFLGRLKTTGMTIREMLRYANLRAKGADTAPERRALLEAHREKVRAHVAELEACLIVLDTKIGSYAEAKQRIQNHDAE